MNMETVALTNQRYLLTYCSIFRWKLQRVATDLGNLMNGRELKVVEYRGSNTFMMKKAIRRACLTTVLVTVCYFRALASLGSLCLRR